MGKRTVDNFELFANTLRWDFVKRSVYHVQIVVRKKDGHPDAHGNNDGRTIRTYMFETKESLLNKESEIKTLCKVFNARAYICPSAKNVYRCMESTAHELITKMGESARTDNHINLHAIIDSGIAKTEAMSVERKKILDVDTLDENKVNILVDWIKAHDNGKRKGGPIYAVVPTPGGYHILTSRFDTRGLDEFIAENDIPVTMAKESETEIEFSILYYCALEDNEYPVYTDFKQND